MIRYERIVSGASCVVAILLMGASLSAGAAVNWVIDPSSGKLTGAGNVDVGGVLYNVEFFDGTCTQTFGSCEQSSFTFQTQADALAAANALKDQVFLNLSDPVSGFDNFDYNPSKTFGCTLLLCQVVTVYDINSSNFMRTAIFNNQKQFFETGPGGDSVVLWETNPYTTTVDFASTSAPGPQTVFARWSVQNTGPYEIGDTGPAGGTVFYFDESSGLTLEAAPTDVSATSGWGCLGVDIDGVESLQNWSHETEGHGESNTAAILSSVCENSSIAASAASDYVWPSGDTDGFLPSSFELQRLWEQRMLLSNVDADRYWSSSELHVDFGEERFPQTNLAWNILWSTGSQGTVWREDPDGVRPIRAFTQNTNTAPTADAGADQSIRAGDTVNLDGGASFDDNTGPVDLLYAWSFSSQPMGSTATLNADITATPSFVAHVAGTYVVDLVVTDEGGLDSPVDQVEISSNNMAPTADAGVDQLVIVGNTVFFDGSGSSDPETNALTYAWAITSAPAMSAAVLSGGTTATPSLMTDLEGAYEVTLTVSDFIGPGAPDAVLVTVASAGDFAASLIVSASDLIASLTAGQVTTGGNQSALGNFLSQAVAALQEDPLDIAKAIDKLEKAIARTDGCILRGSPDGNGSGKDWIIDCAAQAEAYDLLSAAVAALTP